LTFEKVLDGKIKDKKQIRAIFV